MLAPCSQQGPEIHKDVENRCVSQSVLTAIFIRVRAVRQYAGSLRVSIPNFAQYAHIAVYVHKFFSLALIQMVLAFGVNETKKGQVLLCK